MAIAYLGLGSNLGDRRGTLERVLRRIRAQPHCRLLRASSWYETDPVDCPPDSPAYLNGVVKVQTDLPPDRVLSILLAIEEQFGRIRSERNAPRTIDLDLLLYDDLIRTSPDPIVPHPRMHERRFVLEPLSEIAPDVVHPTLQLPIHQLLANLPAAGVSEKEPSLQPLPVARDLIGLRAVVTGSTSGIGKAIAEEFIAAGAIVLRHGRRTTSDPDIISANLREVTECDRLANEAWERLGGIDVWVNNAGADTLTGEAAQWSFERKMEELLAVDVMATIRLSRIIGERMKAGQGGMILTMGWDQAETGMEGDSGQLFTTSKSAVMAFSRSLSLSLAPKVRVNCLAPGWIRTAWGEVASAVWQDRVERETPLRCWGLPEDVAHVAHWLASPAAQFITGQTVAINGGAIR